MADRQRTVHRSPRCSMTAFSMERALTDPSRPGCRQGGRPEGHCSVINAHPMTMEIMTDLVVTRRWSRAARHRQRSGRLRRGRHDVLRGRHRQPRCRCPSSWSELHSALLNTAGGARQAVRRDQCRQRGPCEAVPRGVRLAKGLNKVTMRLAEHATCEPAPAPLPGDHPVADQQASPATWASRWSS